MSCHRKGERDEKDVERNQNQQKSIEILKEHLPAVNKSKHYLFHTINKSKKPKQTLTPTLKSSNYPLQSPLYHNHYDQFKKSTSRNSPNICNI